MPKVSIIVPVYNVEPYLRRCIDSILAQSYTDFELILVDDGSTDASGAICDEYERINSRVQVIHKKNGGAASARNIGISVAKGEFIAFCDSDDIVSPLWIARMIDYSGENTLVIGAFCDSEDNLGMASRHGLAPGTNYGKKDYYLFNEEGIAGFLWNALYRKGIICMHGLRLRERKNEGDYNEDLLFAISYVQTIEKIVYTGYSDYCYKVHDESLSRSNKLYFFDKYAEKYRIWDDFIGQYDLENDSARRKLSTNTLYHFIGALRMAKSIREINRIVESPEMRKCLAWADVSEENPYELEMIKEKQTLQLFIFYKLLLLKEKLFS